METLQELGGHPSAEEVARGLAARGVGVSRATVFNVLDDLSRADLVMVADAGPGAARYELAGNWHHHFVCTVCNAISDVDCRKSAAGCLVPVGVSGTVEAVQVIFRGTCRNCLDEVAG